MKRYPLWKHGLICFCLVLAALYALPSSYPAVPTIDIRPRSNVQVVDLHGEARQALSTAGISPRQLISTGNSTSIVFADTEAQLAARNILEAALGTDIVVALNTRSTAPDWLTQLGAKAIALGLDLRGGVSFLLQVDLDFAIDRFMTTAADVVGTALRDAQIAHTVSRQQNVLLIELTDVAQQRDATDVISRTEPRLSISAAGGLLRASLEGTAREQIAELAVGQNVETLRRRVDELGVAEPVIARQGSTRIAVQLPGLQDTARAKSILGRRAALELRGVDERASASPATLNRARNGIPPPGTELLSYPDGGELLVERRIVLTGDNIVDASYGGDEVGRPAVHLALDTLGAEKIQQYTRSRTGEQLAIVLIDRDRTTLISAPRIESELYARFLIHGGGMDVEEANELALLLRSGALAAPIEIVEERTIGPSLGADNIRSGLGAVTGGFALVGVLIGLYYGVFGLISVGALLANLLCLTALLAVFGANLTLPGLAGFALTLGMAIDANVLINERIREELAGGLAPRLAVEAGYARAVATILDANLTTLIAGLALFVLGSGPVRGFAVVLCLGLATSMFTAVLVSRALADLAYGHRAGRLSKISIG